jgi:hypothetical protein
MKHIIFLLITVAVFASCVKVTKPPEFPFTEENLTVFSTKKDDSSVGFYVRCSKTENMYMLKYINNQGNYTPDKTYPIGQGIGAFPIADLGKYKSSDKDVAEIEFKTGGHPVCPYCRNERIDEEQSQLICAPKIYPATYTIDFCITIDHSGSMDGGSGFLGLGGNKLNEVKKAAKDFVRKRDLNYDRFGVVVFDDSVSTLLKLSSDVNKICETIDSIGSGGGTVFARALGNSQSVLANGGKRFSDPKLNEQHVQAVLFFTDGENADQPQALAKAKQLVGSGIIICAVATNDGDKDYLTKMTGDANLVIMASNGDIGSAFKKAEAVIETTIKAKGGNQ